MITLSNRRFAVLLLLGFLASTAPSRAEDLKARVKHALERDKSSDLAAAPESEKAALRAELKKHTGANRIVAKRATQALIGLGDTETIEHYLRLFNEGREPREWRDAARMLELASEPSVIARVAGQLLKEENAQELLDGDRLMSPRSVLAAKIIVAVGANATQLPASVREAFQNVPSYPSENFRAVVRRWWVTNRAAIASRNYDRVTPPR